MHWYNQSIISAINIIYLFRYDGAQPLPVSDLPSIVGSDNLLTMEEYLFSSDVEEELAPESLG